MTGNLDNLYIHLTNYAINKNSENFVFNTDASRTDVGHKRSLTFVWKYVDEHGGNSQELQQEIRESIVKTLCAVQPQLADSYRSCQPNDDRNDKCFEILGFDVLLDHKLKPWMLEVNHSPSFSTDTPFDEKTKFEILSDTLRLLNLDPQNRIKFYRKKEVESQNRRLGKGKTGLQKLTKEEHTEKRKRHMEKRDRYELAHLGSYTRIYPDTDDPSKYAPLVDTARKLWDEFFCSKRKPPPKKEPTPPAPAKKPKPVLPIKKEPPTQRNTLPAKQRLSLSNTVGAGVPLRRTTLVAADPSPKQTTDAPEKSPVQIAPRLPECQAEDRSTKRKYFSNCDNNFAAAEKLSAKVHFPLIVRLPQPFHKPRSKGFLAVHVTAV